MPNEQLSPVTLACIKAAGNTRVEWISKTLLRSDHPSVGAMMHVWDHDFIALLPPVVDLEQDDSVRELAIIRDNENGTFTYYHSERIVYRGFLKESDVSAALYRIVRRLNKTNQPFFVF